MKSPAMKLVLAVGIGSVLATAVGAGTFTVTLNNGGVFESRYQPKAASWDDNVILVLDEFGNWVGVDRAEVKSVLADIESRGYGLVIDTTTKEFGSAPNDRAAADPDAPADEGGAAKPSALDQMIGKSYDTPLFSEPGAVSGGIPVFAVGLTPRRPEAPSQPSVSDQ
jgi:hypothetical protein